MKKLGFVAITIATLLVGYLWFSPYIALNGLRQAIQNKNSFAIESYVDFQKVRERLKADVSVMLTKQKAGTTDFGAVGLALASSMLDPFINIILTPEVITEIFNSQNLSVEENSNTLEWNIQRDGISRVLITAKDSTSAGLVMERQGLYWKVTQFRIDLDSAFKNQNQ